MALIFKRSEGSGGLLTLVFADYTELTSYSTAEMEDGDRALVLDASGDPTVASGAAEYVWSGAEWRRLSQSENYELEWDQLQGKPASEPVSIDFAVIQKHEHPTNKAILDQITAAFTTELQNQYDAYATSKEDKADRGSADGYAPLDSEANIPSSHLPSSYKEAYVVADITERDAIANTYSGLRAFVMDASADSNIDSGSAEYIHDGTDWTLLTANADISAIVNWVDIVGKPVSTAANIDTAVSNSHSHSSPVGDIEDAVFKRHEHDNKSIIDKIGQTVEGLPTWNEGTWPMDATDAFNWEEIVGKPSSTPAELDSAVDDSHTHTNSSALGKVGESDGSPTWNGSAWPTSPFELDGNEDIMPKEVS